MEAMKAAISHRRALGGRRFMDCASAPMIRQMTMPLSSPARLPEPVVQGEIR